MTYETTRDRFRFFADALDGVGEFANGGALVKYPRESTAKFERRKELAWYVNDLRPACTRFVGYLSKKPATRSGLENPLFARFVDDCDGRGNSLPVWLGEFLVEAKARGSMLALVDMPKVLPATAAEQVATRSIPYLVPIDPEDVAGYSLDERGAFSSVSVNATATVDGEVKAAIRTWTTTGWTVAVGGEVVDSGEHNLGLCPVLPLVEGAEFPSFGEFSQIADVSKRLLNLRSELDEILRGQTFSLLTYQVPPDSNGFDAAGVAEGIGTHNMLTYPGAAPAFIAPPDGPARVYLDAIDRAEATIRRIGLTVEQVEKAESGVALTVRFQALNSSLVRFARSVEDFERRVWFVVAKWLKLNAAPSVSYPKEFAISDLATEVETLQNYQAAGMPDEVIRAKKRQVVSLDFSNVEGADLDVLLGSIDEGSAEIPPPVDNPEEGEQ